MTNTSEQSDSLNDRVESLEIDMVDVKSALNQLIDYSVQNNQRMTDAIDRLAQVPSNSSDRNASRSERTTNGES
jgi:septation ring formation regulator EzrA